MDISTDEPPARDCVKFNQLQILKADYFESLTSNGVPRPHPELYSDAVFIIIVKKLMPL